MSTRRQVALCPLLVAAATTLTAAAPASAAPSRASVATAGVGHNGVGYRASPSDARHRVDVRYAGRAFTIRNREEPIEARGPGCRSTGPRTVRCRPEHNVGTIKLVVYGGNDNVTVRSAPKRFYVFIRGGRGDDVLSALAGSRGSLDGASGSDVLRGSAAPDYLSGLDGDDQLYGAGGNDELSAGRGDDLIDGGPGNDYLGTGWTGNDVIRGGDGDDNMVGGQFAPEIMWPGDPGTDKVDGGAGNDSLSTLDYPGHPEPDSVTCGPGDDFVVADQLDVVAPDCERVEFPLAPRPK